MAFPHFLDISDFPEYFWGAVQKILVYCMLEKAAEHSPGSKASQTKHKVIKQNHTSFLAYKLSNYYLKIAIQAKK
jgi:hypothetical protein